MFVVKMVFEFLRIHKVMIFRQLGIVGLMFLLLTNLDWFLFVSVCV